MSKLVAGQNDLLSVHPEIAKEWHPSKNENLKPSEVTCGSNKKAWWLCPKCYNDYIAIIEDRVYGKGCPYCAGKRVKAGFNDLTALHPEIAKEWHPSKNGDLKPSEVTCGSNKKIWWLCPNCNNNYIARIADRVLGTSCPYCAGQKVKPGFNDLATLRPEIAKEWHPSKNGTLDPSVIACSSSKKAWWHCSTCNSDYYSVIAERTRGTGCPYCAGQKVKPGYNDMLTRQPDIAKYWHPVKNGTIKPSDILPHSLKKYWWQCPFCGHEWIDTPNNRCYSKLCPNCVKTLKTSFPEQAILFYIKNHFHDAISRDKSNGFEIDVFIPSISTGIEYDSIYYHANKERGIPDEEKDKLCRAHGIKLYRIREPGLSTTPFAHNILLVDMSYDNLSNAVNIILKELHCDPIANIEEDTSKILAQYKYFFIENSLFHVAPSVAEKWDYQKNAPLKPENVVSGSGMKMWWKCKKCGHEWRARIIYEVYRGNDCPCCSNKKAKKVYQYNKDGSFIAAYSSASEACKITGTSASTISKACKNKLKTAGGYIWTFIKVDK